MSTPLPAAGHAAAHPHPPTTWTVRRRSSVSEPGTSKAPGAGTGKAPGAARDTTSGTASGTVPAVAAGTAWAAAGAGSTHTSLRRQVNRRYEFSWLARNGDILDVSRSAPALPRFEEAFSAFGRGTMFHTDQGPRAVEDLLPGDMIETFEGDYQPVLWLGSMLTGAPPPGSGTAQAPDNRQTPNMFRLMAEAFGPGRPFSDLMLGPAARLLQRSDRLRQRLGLREALVPVQARADGHSVIALQPLTAQRTWHLMLPAHRVIRANGVEVESFHPGSLRPERMGWDLRTEFLALFPHLRPPGQFGALACPRLSATEMASLLAA
jgi:Hint domain-containing protein